MRLGSVCKGSFVKVCIVTVVYVAMTSSALGFQSTEQLVNQVRAHYQPDHLRSYKVARDFLYTYIDNQDDYLTCIYTGEEGHLSSHSGHPRQDACHIGFNAEHIYPQSKGAKIAGKSDLHHLFAVHRNPNSARGNLPFGEIDDAEPSDWYCEANPQRFVPDSPDHCSQGDKLIFEPRVEARGVVARAMFYFYTIYRAAANKADPHYFPSQQNLLCRWHRDYPPTDEEVERSHRVAEVQGNENPFVLDPMLAEQTYCAGVY